MSAIDGVLANYVKPIPEGPTELKIESLKRKLEAIPGLNKSLFAAEATRSSFAKEERIIKSRLNILELAKPGIPEMNPGFLASLNTQGLPAFVLVEINDDRFYLNAAPRNDDWEDPRKFLVGNHSRCTNTKLVFRNSYAISEKLQNQYQTGALNLAKKLMQNKYFDMKKPYLYIEADLKSGAMPDNLRKLISEVESKFCQIYLVVEVPEWKIDGMVEITGKTLVVGWINDTEQMFLIGSYIPIPIDEYLSQIVGEKQVKKVS